MLDIQTVLNEVYFTFWDLTQYEVSVGSLYPYNWIDKESTDDAVLPCSLFHLPSHWVWELQMSEQIISPPKEGVLS